MKRLSVFLASVALVQGFASAAPTVSYYAPEQQLERWHNERWIGVPPNNPGNPSTAIQQSIGNSIRSTSPSSFWNVYKSGGTRLLPGTMNLAKGLGRSIGYGAAISIGAGLINKGLERFFQQMQQDASPQGNLYRCLSNSAANNTGVSLDSVCESRTSNTAIKWPHGSYDKTFNNWWEVRHPSGFYHFYVSQEAGGKYGVAYACPAKQFTNNHSLQSVSQVEALYTQYVQVCVVESPQRTDITLNDYITGRPEFNIEPDSKIVPQIIDATAKYVENTPPTIDGTAPLYPGVTLNPLPTRHQLYGNPIDCRVDTDSDGWGDCEELLRNSDPDDKNSVPDIMRDSDGDGVRDEIEDRFQTNPYDPNDKPTDEQLKEFTDLDADGVPDKDDLDIDGDGVPNESDPEPLNKNIPVRCNSGYKPSLDGKTCVPEQSEEKCPEGQKLNDATPPKCVLDEEKTDNPVGDACGDFSLKRLTAHTAHYLRDVFFSCDRQGLDELSILISTKFPFSLIGSLNGLVTADGGNGENPLPTKIGPFELDWLFASSFFAFAKIAFRAVLWFMFASWLIGRLSGQVVLQ